MNAMTHRKRNSSWRTAIDLRIPTALRFAAPDLELWQQQNPLVPSLQAPALAAFNPHIGKPLSAILRLERAAGEDRRALRQP